MTTTPTIRHRKTFQLRLSKFELVHLRDLFSVLLATEAKQTVSQALAVAENRPTIEARLWQRIVDSCQEAGLPLDAEAPDFICAAMVPPPPVGVFRVSHDPEEGVEETSAGHPFVTSEGEEE